MKTAAIICEYNPFHNGHLYQIERIKQELEVDRIICIMSGDFVQRGEPAVMSKELRTRIALESGADLVLLLPVCFSTAAADMFAYGAVSILDKLGVVDYLCFGSECDSLEALKNVSEKIRHYAFPTAPEIQSLLKSGKTYAEARATLLPECSDILNGSNNILAIEYLNALYELKSSISPFLIKREGASYTETTIIPGTALQSASSIRKLIESDSQCSYNSFVPALSLKYMDKTHFVFTSDFDLILKYSLMSTDDLTMYSDVSSDLAGRIKNNLNSYIGVSEFAELIKSRNYTRARINRALIHILLNMKENNSTLKTLADNISHVRVLGFKKASSDVLTLIAKNGTVKAVTKIPDVYNEMSEPVKNMFDTDEYVSSVYDSVISVKTKTKSVPEYSKSIVMV